VSRSRLRQNDICLNCGTTVPERYCSRCGQENIEPKESLWHLITHFFSDITHYDSKFFSTIKTLLLRPGFLTREYITGRRAKYLNPIRAYVFISAVFFLILFAQRKHESLAENKTDDAVIHVKQHLADSLQQAILPAQTTHDSIKNTALREIASSLTVGITPPPKEQAISFALNGEGVRFTLTDTRYKNLQEYDSIQSTMSDSLKDKGFMRLVVRKNIRLNNQYGNRRAIVLEENFKHSVPKLVFLLLPLFACYVMLFYNRKKYLYTEHAIFAIHYHSFLFLFFLLMMLLNWIFSAGWFELIILIASLLIMFFYLVTALKNTYLESFWRSFGKAIAIGILYIITMIIGLLLLAFFTFMAA